MKVEDMTSFTEKSKVADSRRPGTSALFTSDSNFPSKHTNLPQKLQELSWQICYFCRDPFDKKFIIYGAFCIWFGEKPVLPFFFSTKNGVGLWNRWTLYAKVGDESSESGFDVQLCGGAFGTDALAVLSRSFAMWKITKRFQDMKK